MSRYDIDFTKDTIVVDGHVFKEMIDNPGVYEATDEYIIYCGTWCRDESNYELRAVVEPVDVWVNFDMRILYVGNYDDERMTTFAEKACSEQGKFSKYFYDRVPIVYHLI